MNVWQRLLWVGIGLPASLCLAINPSDLVDCKRHYCSAVVDAGSSGSRIHWYYYDLDKQHNPIHIQEAYSKKIKPGLATIAQDPATIAAYIEQLMSGFSIENVPISFFATAGMRLLPVKSQEHYYSAIKEWFANHPQWPLREVRTISGKEEGVYGWLSLNYHLKTLQTKHKSLVGLIEVGGASAQIATPINHSSGMNPADYSDITIYGRHIRLFAHSFLGLGINQLYAYSQQHYPSCFAINYPLADGLKGLGNGQQCQMDIGILLQQTYHVNNIAASAVKYSDASSWYTVSAVSQMVANSPFEFSNQAFSGVALLNQSDKQFCQQDYQYLNQQYPTYDFVQNNCLLAAYFSGLLSFGLGFEPEHRVRFVPDYAGSWTLGVLLSRYQTS